MGVCETALETICDHELAQSSCPVLLMVSGGSDSTALAYMATELHKAGKLGPLAMLHVNHRIREHASDIDEAFVVRLAEMLEIPLFNCMVDIPRLVEEEHGNVEAIARRERYHAAYEALTSVCHHESVPIQEGRIFTAHTANDRIENFYMRSIVGTGPGGFRSMRYLNGQVARPVLDISRDELREYIEKRAQAGLPVVRDDEGNLWREDATNTHTDQFRAYVRSEIVPAAYRRNNNLHTTLTRTMNLIADEDDMLERFVDDICRNQVDWIDADKALLDDFSDGCLINPDFINVEVPLQRRCIKRILEDMLGNDARIETSSIDAVLQGFTKTGVNSGYVNNIQGNIAVSANKQGVRVEPMAAFRSRRKRID